MNADQSSIIHIVMLLLASVGFVFAAFSAVQTKNRLLTWVSIAGLAATLCALWVLVHR